MWWKLHNSRVCYAPDDNSGGGGNTSSDDGGTKSGTENNIDPFKDFWQDDSTVSDADKQTAQQQQNTQQQPNNNDAFSDHVKNLSFVGGDDISEAMAAAAQGDTKALVDVMNNIGREAYKQSLLTSAQLNKSQIQKAVDAAMKNVRGSVDTDLAVRELRERLPIANDPLFGPNARAIFTRAVTKGHSVDEAVTLTENYFSRLGARVVGDKGINKKVSSRPGSGGFKKDDPLEALFMDAGGDSDVEANDFDALLSQK